MDTTDREIIRRLEYDKDSGKLFWKFIPEVDGVSKRYNTIYAGKEAGSYQKSSGYLIVQVRGKAYKAHRLCWFLHHGFWPKNTIDHRNLVKTDNRITNLRDFSMAQQSRNKPISKTNNSGTTGVHFCNSRGKWVARIFENGVRTWLGYFHNKEDACAARLASQFSKDFYESHGMEAPV